MCSAFIVHSLTLLNDDEGLMCRGNDKTRNTDTIPTASPRALLLEKDSTTWLCGEQKKDLFVCQGLF